MAYKPTCPVCYVEMDTYSDTMDGMVLLESGERCFYGCYEHRYAYGNTEVHVHIGGPEKVVSSFYLNHHDHPKEKLDLQNRLTAELVQARVVLIEDLRKQAKILPGLGFGPPRQSYRE